MRTLSKNPDVIALIFIVLLLAIAAPDKHDPIHLRPFLTEVVGRLP